MEAKLKIAKSEVLHKDRVWSVSWGHKDGIIASTSGDCSLKLWDKSLSPLDSFVHDRTVRRVKFAPDGKQLAICSFNGKVLIYKLENGVFEEYAELEGHESEVKSISWSADSSLLATCGRDKSVWVWECWEDGDYECAGVITSHSADVKDICFHPYDCILVSVSYDMTVKLFKEFDGEWDCIQTLTGHTDTVWCASWRPDGAKLATAGSDLCVRVWAFTNGKLELEANIQGIHDRTIYSVDWGEKGIVTGCADNKIRLLQESEGAWICVDSIAVMSDVNSVAWSKSGQQIAAGTDDGDLVLVDLVE